jgi:hypothetical protein
MTEQRTCDCCKLSVQAINELGLCFACDMFQTPRTRALCTDREIAVAGPGASAHDGAVTDDAAAGEITLRSAASFTRETIMITKLDTLAARMAARQLAEKSPARIELATRFLTELAIDAIAESLNLKTPEQDARLVKLLSKRANEIAAKMATDLVSNLAGELAEQLL